MLKVNDDEKASISLKRILGICLIFLFISGICVFAANKQVKNVKITLSNGCEMNVVTSKTKVADILDEKHIILLPEEKVTPDENTTIGANGEIVITEKTAQEEVAELVSNETEATTTEENANELSMEMISQAYNPITEKTIVEVQSIPFETVTKNVANGASETKDQVLQEGREGKKEVTYRVKYQNDVEIERIELSSTVIKEPVNKIVQIQTQVSSRASTAVSYGNGRWSYSAKELDLLCAITAQECSSSYEGALAVITCACNRAESSKWRSKGTDPLSQYKAKGQFCYSIDSNWKKRLNGNYTAAVKQAVLDALNGKRNHNYLSFRSARSYSGGVNIGGNAYFNPM